MVDGQVNTRFRFIADTRRGVQAVVNGARQIQTGLGKAEKGADQTTKAVGRLGGGLVSTAFQFSFMAAVAGVAFDQIKNALIDTVTVGARGIDEMTRAIFQSGVTVHDVASGNMKDFNLYRDAILDLGTGDSIFSVEEVARSFKEIGKAVQDSAFALPLLTESLKLQTIEEVNAQTAAIGLSKMFEIFKDQISDITELSDVLVAVNQQSSITLDQLIRSYGFAAQGAKFFGLSMSETGAIIGVLNQQMGIQAGGPGRALRRLISELTDSQTLLNQELRSVGITLLDQEGNFRDIRDIVKDYRNLIGKMPNDAMKAQILELTEAGELGKAALLALVQTSEEDLDKAFAGAAQRGLAEQLTSIFENTPEGQIKKLKNAIEGLKIAFTVGFAPALTEIAQTLRDLIRDKEVQTFFRELGSALANEIIPAFKIAFKMFRDFVAVLGKNKEALQGLVKVFFAFAAALGLVSILGVVGALAAIVARGFAFMSVALGLSTMGMFRLFAVAILALAAINALKNLIPEFNKKITDMDPAVTGLNAALLVLASTAAGFAIGGPPGALIGFLGSLAAIAITGIVGQVQGLIDTLKKFDEVAQARGYKNFFDDLTSNVPVLKEVRAGIEELAAAFKIAFDIDPELGGRLVGEFVRSIFKPIEEAIANFVGTLSTIWFNNMNFTEFGVSGEAIWNNIWMGIKNALSNIPQLIGDIIDFFISGEWLQAGKDIAKNILDGMVAFFTEGPQNLVDAVTGAFSNIGNPFQGVQDFLGGFMEGFMGEQELDSAVNLLDQLEEETKNRSQLNEALKLQEQFLNSHNELFGPLLENSEVINELDTAKIGLEETQNTQLEELSNTIDTLTITQNQKIGAEEQNIQKIETNIKELQTLNEKIPPVQVAIDEVRDALRAVRDALRELEAKIRRTNIKFEKNEEGQITGFKLTGGVTRGQIDDLATSFAEGGIVRTPRLATVGDAGPEAIIPLSQLPGLIREGLEGGTGRSNITVNATINIDNSNGRMSPEEIKNIVLDGIAKEFPNKILLRRG